MSPNIHFTHQPSPFTLSKVTLTFAQTGRRNLTAPIVSAIVVVVIVTALVVFLSPPTTAIVSVKNTAVYATLTEFKSEANEVGRVIPQKDLYALVNVHIENHLKVPLFLKDFTSDFNPSDPNAELLKTSAIEKPEFPNLFTVFPALKTLIEQQNAPLLYRETQIDPGKSADGIIILHFPIDQAAWDQRKSATLSVDLYHQPTATVEIPKQATSQK
jgi:hypothetical protein